MFNQFVALGRIVKDAEFRYISTGVPVASFTLAINHKKNKVCFIECVVWDKMVELYKDFLDKGNKILIQGFLYTDVWEADGVKHYRTKCQVETLRVLETKQNNEQQREDEPF